MGVFMNQQSDRLQASPKSHSKTLILLPTYIFSVLKNLPQELINLKDDTQTSLSSIIHRNKYRENNETHKLAYRLPLVPDGDTLSKWEELAAQKPITPKNQLKQIGPFLTCKSPESHKKAFIYAIDFLVPDGTIVTAARSWTIIKIKDDSSEWWPDQSYADCANLVTIEHDCADWTKEFSQYIHLSQWSVTKSGFSQRALLDAISKWEKWLPVKVWDIIGKVGKTGWTDRDHLHFIIFRWDLDPKNKYGFRSLQARFTG